MPSVFASSVAPMGLWLGFIAAVVILLLLDLGVFHKRAHKIKVKEALLESGIWISIALSFNAWFAWQYGTNFGVEFLTSYLVEKSLSIDNLFVILLIFDSIRIPHEHRHRVLFYGILGAILMRGILIILGTELVYLSHWVLYLFGIILVVTAVKFIRETDHSVDVTESLALRLLKRVYPISDRVEGMKFFVKEGGRKKGTRLLVALFLIETTDLVFAFDSIPAVLAVTHDAFVAFASNILAILGLRALYFVIADWITRLRYLKPGLATILGFIGIKMLIADFYKIPSWVSLLVIVGVLTTAALTSWYVTRLEKRA